MRGLQVRQPVRNVNFSLLIATSREYFYPPFVFNLALGGADFSGVPLLFGMAWPKQWRSVTVTAVSMKYRVAFRGIRASCNRYRSFVFTVSGCSRIMDRHAWRQFADNKLMIGVSDSSIFGGINRPTLIVRVSSW